MLILRAIEGFHIGGEVVTLSGLPVEQHRLAQGAASRSVDPNGDYVTGQMYAQVFRLATPRHATPVLFWHGGGMTGAHWESTPDGRQGWLTRFLEAGFDVIVSDAVERGRASWSPFPHIYPGPPLVRTMNEAWEMFRIGPADGYATDPARRVSFDGQQFPSAAFDQFARQFVPRWADHEAMTQASYDALIRHVGPCIVVSHSQGAGFALRAAQLAPHLVRAVVGLEPSGAPAPCGAPLPRHLVVWGDYVHLHPVWRSYREAVDRYVGALPPGTADTLDLPGEGVAGNSHFMMLDRNSDQIAARVIEWLRDVAT